MLLIALNVAGKLAALLLARTAPSTAFALWFIPDLVLAYHLFVPNARGLLRVYRRFTTVAREVWLTLDDGPDPTDTPRLLALLAAHDARATFFLIGENAAAHPDLVRAIAAAGHEIGHHTHTHPLASFWCATPSRLHRELNAGFAALASAGVHPTRFRAPAGLKNLALKSALAAHGLTCIGWSARGLERRHRAPAAVAAAVTRALAPGAILLLHEGPRVPAAIRVEAIRLTLAHLTAAGYRCIIPPPSALR